MKKLGEIAKKKMRYEILEELENYLNRKIDELNRDIQYNSDPENWGTSEEMPEWRKEDNEMNNFRIKEVEDIIKALAKL